LTALSAAACSPEATRLIEEFPAVRAARQALARLHPLGLTDDWADKLKGKSFKSDTQRVTHEHYMNVVLTTIEPKVKVIGNYDAYEYTLHSHQYNSEDIPSAKFTYNTSPVQVWAAAPFSELIDCWFFDHDAMHLWQ
jgi:hypothetical protein